MSHDCQESSLLEGLRIVFYRSASKDWRDSLTGLFNFKSLTVA